jgi:hypothetical protein
MGSHVRHGGRLTCRARRRDCGRIAGLARRRMRPGGEGAHHADPHLATCECSETVDGLMNTCIARDLRLEQRQRPLGTVGGPHGQHPPVVLAQREGARLALHGSGEDL